MCKFCKEWPQKYNLRYSSVKCFTCEHCGTMWHRKRGERGDVWYTAEGEKFFIPLSGESEEIPEKSEENFSYYCPT